MKKTKVWIRDALSKSVVDYYRGQKVTVFRRKASGYPKFLKDGETYIVKYVLWEDLIVQEEVSNSLLQPREWKINKTYVIPIEFNREFLIDEILKEILD